MKMTLLIALTTVVLPMTTPAHAPAHQDRGLVSVSEPSPSIAEGRKSCGHGIRACSASQVGQPCNPNNPNIICSAQANGAYCCLAYAP